MQAINSRPARWLTRAETLVFPLCRQVPFPLQQRLLQTALEKLLAQEISDGELDFLENRTVAIQVTDMGIGWRVVGRHPQLRVLTAAGESDVTVHGRARAFALLASGREDPDTLFFRRELSLEGDTELGLAVKNLLDSIDLEALPFPLRRLLGGVGAVASLMA